MPIPSPHKGEVEEDFISRCMGDSVMVADYSDQKQRAAVCYSSWRKEHDEKAAALPGGPMRLYIPIAKVDAEQRMVWGYASTEARDDQGEVIQRAAIEAALGDYMKFANIREMHQLSAVGIAKEAAVDEKGLYVGARIVDDPAWAKVTEGVYKGFSIGGKVLERESGNTATITKLRLDEISLVDRPANPEAIFDCWKRAEKAPDTAPLNTLPLQIWACNDPAHRHLAKAEAAQCLALMAKAADPPAAGVVDQIATTLAAAQTAIEAANKAIEAANKAQTDDGDADDKTEKADDEPYGDVEYADPGYQEDGKKRYPIDTEEHIRAAWNYINKPGNSGKYSADEVKRIKAKIVAAWKDKIDSDGPPSAKDDGADKAAAAIAAVQKALADTGRVASIILELDWLASLIETEALMEGDNSPQPARLRGIIRELADFMNAFVAEETAEVVAGTEIDPLSVGTPFAWAAIAGSLRKSGKEELAMKIEKASRHEGALLHMAHHAVEKAIGMGGLSAEKAGHLESARLALAAALPPGEHDEGATEHSTTDTGKNPTHPAPTTGGADPTKALVIEGLAKHGGHQALMDVAHNCIRDASDGMVCAAGANKAHSAEAMTHLHNAHFHLVAAGAKCDAAGFHAEGEHQGADEDTDKASKVVVDPATTDLVKTLASQNAELIAAVGALTKRVEAMAAVPLPPGAVARVIPPEGPTGPTIADIDAAWKALTPDERSRLEIVNALRHPQTPRGRLLPQPKP